MFIKPLPWSSFTETQKKSYLRSIICLLIIITAAITLDQITKELSATHLQVSSSPDNIREYRGSMYPLLSFGKQETAKTTGPYLAMNLSYVRNPGAAWGSLSQMDDRYRVPFFHIITFLCIAFIIFYLRATPYSHRLARYALALIFAGAMGNMIDRVRLHYVIDWIDVRWNIWGWYYVFPNFNWADIFISVGAFLFILDASLITYLRRKRFDALEKTSP